MKRSPGRQVEPLEFARSQRRTANEFAETLWQWIRNRQIGGCKFRREFPIPPYTADFCCVELQLIIEVDGESHLNETGMLRDANRDRYLDHLGYKVIRITGFEILRDGRAVIVRVTKEVNARKADHNQYP